MPYGIQRLELDTGLVLLLLLLGSLEGKNAVGKEFCIEGNDAVGITVAIQVLQETNVVADVSVSSLLLRVKSVAYLCN